MKRRFALSFKGELERKFLDLFFEQSIAQMRFAFGLALVLYSSFGLLDAVAAPRKERSYGSSATSSSVRSSFSSDR